MIEKTPAILYVIPSKNSGRIFFAKILCEKRKLQGKNARRINKRVSARKAPVPYRNRKFFFLFKMIRYIIRNVVTIIQVKTEPQDGLVIQFSSLLSFLRFCNKDSIFSMTSRLFSPSIRFTTIAGVEKVFVTADNAFSFFHKTFIIFR